MKYYNVNFKWYDTDTWCSNIAKAETIEDVKAHYAKYGSEPIIKEASAYDVESAIERGKPIIKCQHIETEPEAENDQTRFADFLETFLHRSETVQTDENHRYTINGDRVQLFELMGDRWVALGDPETWDAALIDELKRA